MFCVKTAVINSPSLHYFYDSHFYNAIHLQGSPIDQRIFTTIKQSPINGALIDQNNKSTSVFRWENHNNLKAITLSGLIKLTPDEVNSFVFATEKKIMACDQKTEKLWEGKWGRSKSCRQLLRVAGGRILIRPPLQFFLTGANLFIYLMGAPIQLR